MPLSRQGWHERAARRLLGTIIAIPVVGLCLALIVPASPPAPGITPPTQVAMLPLRSPQAIEARIVDMTPSLRLAQPEPAYPGSIQLAALSLPQHAPEIEPTLSTPTPALVLPPLALAPLTEPVRPDLTPSPRSLDAGAPPEPPAPAQCYVAVEPAVDAEIETPPRAQVAQALAAAALQQTSQVVVYDARYTRIAYPGGDVVPMQGVCTDVVIRAYRALGIDLQRLVHESRLGAGDTSIDHRRTETLRRFLATFGETLPVTPFVEDYQPGDIVTYHRPQNRTSTAHIAIVSDVIAPSGRPMIIHNRGLGVQLEDALFVDRITGHYRYAGPTTPLPPLATSAFRPAPRLTVATVAAGGTTVVRAAAKSPAAAKLFQRYSVVTPAAALRAVPLPRP